jgi:16S rRNA (cytosine967-C5)-methyltransferase
VPCSGSGTLSRTPEWLSFFKGEQLTDYVKKQRKVISNAVKKLQTGKLLIYITCSVYADENEDIFSTLLSSFL